MAATLGVADELADGPRRVEDVAEAVGAHPDTLYRLLRALAGAGVFQELDGRRFAPAPAGELLRSGVPGSLRDWLQWVGHPLPRQAWGALLESVRTGESAFERVHGTDVVAYVQDRPQEAELFRRAMKTMTGQVIQAVVAAYDFGAFGTVVDVGGARGEFIAAALAAEPKARGVFLDLPHLLAEARETVREAGVADRCELVAGDLRESVPPGGDAYVLFNVLHNWDDEQAVRILANCRTALGDREEGRVLVSEVVLPDGPEPSLAAWIDLELLVIARTGTRQRTAREYRELCARAGLRPVRTVPGPGTLQILEAAVTAGSAYGGGADRRTEDAS
ncbi:acetylserotonin O-methyltransferase [Streptomyces sp. MST-110588]|uniref:acetylserotonin O-methyltransferase n=1 Tax=Streptomyces sp. MST-110588 TaxID=2833628 RepID=UPI001F5CBC64|nr:acetylserotonin O-methyltransferase [Streptomyces sp. MST-110588]